MEEARTVYRWEQGINATWESVQEDAEGRIVSTGFDRDRANRAKQHRITQSIRRGLIRYLVVALDCSASALEKDYRPSRLEVCKNTVQRFVTEFYDQNPISQLSIMLTRDRTAERVTDLSGNARNHIDKVKKIQQAVGLASLQNTILLALNILKHIPNYGHRELVVVYNSLSSCDPGDIFTTVQEARKQKLRVSVICTAAELFICKQVAELTGGTFSVAMDATHLMDLLAAHTLPPPSLDDHSSSAAVPPQADFIYMGFPKRTFDTHLLFGYEGKKLAQFGSAYICPQCGARASDIPTSCAVCNLQLNSSSHIARSFHHLFPVPPYVEYEVIEAAVAGTKSALIKKEGNGKGQHQQQQQQHSRFIAKRTTIDLTQSTSSAMQTEDTENSSTSTEQQLSLQGESSRCFGCMTLLAMPERLVFQCPRCSKLFCVDCDLFVHDVLHNCPGCTG